jgi:hypothetical protein
VISFRLPVPFFFFANILCDLNHLRFFHVDPSTLMFNFFSDVNCKESDACLKYAASTGYLDIFSRICALLAAVNGGGREAQPNAKFLKSRNKTARLRPAHVQSGFRGQSDPSRIYPTIADLRHGREDTLNRC